MSQPNNSFETTSVFTYVTKGVDSLEFNQEIIRADKVVGTGQSTYSNRAPEMGKPLLSPALDLLVQLKAAFPPREISLYLSVLRHFEDARSEMLTRKGVDTKAEREERGIRFMIASLEVRCMDAMLAEPDVLIRTGINVHLPQFIFQQEMVRNGQIIIKANTRCALVDRDNNLVHFLEVLNPFIEKLSR